MTTQEMRELARTVASIMELEPPMMPLHAIRQQRDELYNDAERNSKGGWWIAKTGFDAGKSSDFCKWEPRDATTDPAAAMEVLKKLLKNWPFTFELSGNSGKFGIWYMDKDANEFYVHADTLELAICQFAKKLFTK